MNDPDSTPEYYVDEKQLEGFTRQVCQAMAQRHNDPSYLDSELVFGLAGFLKIIARVKARGLNQSDKPTQG